MNERARAAAVMGLLAIAAGVVAQSGGAGEAEKPAEGAPAITLMPEMDGAILYAAREYKAWERVSDQPAQAPEMCGALPPLGVKSSTSQDQSTHGSKLYYLHARMPRQYFALFVDVWPTPFVNGQSDASQVGQTLVKESWQAVPIDAQFNARIQTSACWTDHETGKTFTTGDQRDLFIMLKVDPKTPGTDDGWIYAVVDPKEKKVRASGRLENCMGCHDSDQTRDRLFGPK